MTDTIGEDIFDLPDGEALPGDTWRPVDLTAVVSGVLDGTIERPTPALGIRDDKLALFYPARVNGLAGESGAGKSWVMLHVSAEQIEEGNHVIFIDLEDNESGVVSRLLALGVAGHAIVDQFHYLHPDEPYNLEAARNVHQLIAAHHPTLVVIDSTGEALALDGVKDQDDEVARWFRRFPRAIADAGPAVIVADHVTKNRETRGLHAIGSQRKRAAITGAMYIVEPIKTMGIGHAGAAKLTTGKDRNGTHPTGSVAAVFHLDATEDKTAAALTAPTNSSTASGQFRPTVLMEKVSRYLELHPRASKNAIESDVTGRRDYLRQALDVLVAEGWVTAVHAGRALQHSVVTPFRDVDDDTEATQ